MKNNKIKEVSYIKLLLFILCVLLLVISVKYSMLKRQIRSITKQMNQLNQGKSEKILDLSLIDSDLENLASELNQQYQKQRSITASALRQEENLKESIANLSHDLRTPLTIIIGHLQLLQKSKLSEEQTNRVEVALRKSFRLKNLISTFYELSVLDSNHMELNLENINVSNLFMDFIAEQASQFYKKQIQPEIHMPQSSIFIKADSNMLERIFQNLLTNAIKYTKGTINISFFDTQKHVIFQIENTIDESHQLDTERIFERFYTGNPSRNGESSGLGLAVVKSLVEKMNGTINASLCNNSLSIQITFFKE